MQLQKQWGPLCRQGAAQAVPPRLAGASRSSGAANDATTRRSAQSACVAQCCVAWQAGWRAQLAAAQHAHVSRMLIYLSSLVLLTV